MALSLYCLCNIVHGTEGLRVLLQKSDEFTENAPNKVVSIEV